MKIDDLRCGGVRIVFEIFRKECRDTIDSAKKHLPVSLHAVGVCVELVTLYSVTHRKVSYSSGKRIEAA